MEFCSLGSHGSQSGMPFKCSLIYSFIAPCVFKNQLPTAASLSTAEAGNFGGPLEPQPWGVPSLSDMDSLAGYSAFLVIKISKAQPRTSPSSPLPAKILPCNSAAWAGQWQHLPPLPLLFQSWLLPLCCVSLLLGLPPDLMHPLILSTEPGC